jgi:hypothetical protein
LGEVEEPLIVAFARLCIVLIGAVDERHLTRRFEDRKADVVPEPAVTFKLRFGEPLVGGTVVGKYWMLFLVIEDVGRFVARERGLYIDHGSRVLRVLGVDNRAHNTMRGAIVRIFHALQRP